MAIKVESTKIPIIVIIAVIIAAAAYMKIWESRQAKVALEGVKIIRIESFHRSLGELHLSFSGYRVYIENEDKPIEFSKDNWCDSIQVNDTVDMIVREKMFENKFDGFHIEKKQ